MTVRDSPITQDLDALLGDDRDTLSTDEQYQRIKDKLHYERFAPQTTPDVVSTDLYNPAITGYIESEVSWNDNGWSPVDKTRILRRFPEYIPTDEAITTLVNLGPLVEVGAGDGYWSHIITENDGESIPTDLSPETPDTTEFPTTLTYDMGDETIDSAIWADVQELGGVNAVQSHPDRTVLMCHPSGSDRWSENVLEAIDDQPFVFIGEWFPGADATPRFFKTLAEDWELITEFPVYDWESMHAHGYVFQQMD